MSEQKILTLCIPTYNRATHLEEQLKRLSSMPVELWDSISLLISDNCSTDGTEEVVKKYLAIPHIDIEYSRNATNLGMDGNFVKCFKAAKTKYVWLLGDDDYIKTDKLEQIISLLQNNSYGVCHLSVNNVNKEPYTKYCDDTEHFLKDIGVYITYISSNIVNTKYVNTVDFQKYYGTFFTLIPLYLNAMIDEKINVMFNERVFEDGKDVVRNGGYNYIQVFVKNYLNIFKEYFQTGKISGSLYSFEEDVALSMAVPYLVRYVIFRKKSNYETVDSWKIMFEYYGIKRTLLSIIKGGYSFVLRRFSRHLY